MASRFFQTALFPPALFRGTPLGAFPDVPVRKHVLPCPADLQREQAVFAEPSALMRQAAQGEGTVHIRQTLTSPIRQAVSFPHQTDCTVPRPTGCTVLRPTGCTVPCPTGCTARPTGCFVLVILYLPKIPAYGKPRACARGLVVFWGSGQSTSSMATGTECRERRRTPSASVSSVSVCTSPLASVTLSVTGWLW